MNTFQTEYEHLEEQFRHKALQEGTLFFPNIPPGGPVDYVLIAQEPGFGDHHTALIKHGVRNFLFQTSDICFHLALQRFLCRDIETYHLTDLAKGSMPNEQATRRPGERYDRWDRWYQLLQDELALVTKPETRIFAIGADVEKYLTGRRNSFEIGRVSLEKTRMPHYSEANKNHWKHTVASRQADYDLFATTIHYADIEHTDRSIRMRAGIPDPRKRWPFHLHHKWLIFAVKVAIENWRASQMITRGAQ